MSARFNTKPLREVKKILGVRVTRNRKEKTLDLDQEQYVDGLLTKFGFPKATLKPVYVLINKDTDLSLSKPDDIRTDLTEYRERIGSIIYLIVYTRLDIAYALGRLS